VNEFGFGGLKFNPKPKTQKKETSARISQKNKYIQNSSEEVFVVKESGGF
jgi:hypothetical protein